MKQFLKLWWAGFWRIVVWSGVMVVSVLGLFGFVMLLDAGTNHFPVAFQTAAHICRVLLTIGMALGCPWFIGAGVKRHPTQCQPDRG